LHHAATTLPDLECVEYLKKAATEDSSDLTVVDCIYSMLLYTLVCKLKLNSIMWLLENVSVVGLWKMARDIYGDSLLDVL
jgi:hypothetical protein